MAGFEATVKAINPDPNRKLVQAGAKASNDTLTAAPNAGRMMEYLGVLKGVANASLNNQAATAKDTAKVKDQKQEKKVKPGKAGKSSDAEAKIEATKVTNDDTAIPSGEDLKENAETASSFIAIGTGNQGEPKLVKVEETAGVQVVDADRARLLVDLLNSNKLEELPVVDKHATTPGDFFENAIAHSQYTSKDPDWSIGKLGIPLG